MIYRSALCNFKIGFLPCGSKMLECVFPSVSHISEWFSILCLFNYFLATLLPIKFYPPKVDHPLGGPLWGPNLISFCLISSLRNIFLISIYRRFFAIFDPKNFLSPGGGPTYVVLLWGPIWVSFSFISSPKKTFLGLNLQAVSAHFWPAKFFILTDGWWIRSVLVAFWSIF